MTTVLQLDNLRVPVEIGGRLEEWVVRALARTSHSIHGRPVELLETDYQAMLPLPPVAPSIGFSQRVRLGRDYYVRVDTVDYSVDPRMIDRFVDVTASPREVTLFCEGQVVARHDRCWAKQIVVTDHVHQQAAAALRQNFAAERRRRETAAGTRRHPDGHVVALRALPDYDALFGVDSPHHHRKQVTTLSTTTRPGGPPQGGLPS